MDPRRDMIEWRPKDKVFGPKCGPPLGPRFSDLKPLFSLDLVTSCRPLLSYPQTEFVRAHDPELSQYLRRIQGGSEMTDRVMGGTKPCNVRSRSKLDHFGSGPRLIHHSVHAHSWPHKASRLRQSHLRRC